ncbi:hypothetical protein [Herpetosiphon sp. NSE202]|uniref:hypothetical protein n=1 Tax=Herpetosiphon sp. NSE202 TaxID=3351349 RepID=UPI0036350D1C
MKDEGKIKSQKSKVKIGARDRVPFLTQRRREKMAMGYRNLVRAIRAIRGEKDHNLTNLCQSVAKIQGYKLLAFG